MEFNPAPVDPLSYREYIDQYGGGLAEFSLHSLAYLLQQQRDTLDPRITARWESQLIDTRYNTVAYEQLKLEGVI